MPPSQLKRLKASLREHGIVGPQKSKKNSKKSRDRNIIQEKKLTRKVALASIREQFNPFEYKVTQKSSKFESTSSNISKVHPQRLSTKKSHDEETHREAYFAEQKRKKKVGGILDKRFGENDPTLAPEEKMLERFVREKQLRLKKKSIFDLEDTEYSEQLTHLGKELSFDSLASDDDLTVNDETISIPGGELNHKSLLSLKRSRIDDDHPDKLANEDEEHLMRKKSKREVMQEMIAKSKLYKYERQAAKDEDEELREELDKQTAEVNSLLRVIPSNPSSEPQHLLLQNSEKITPSIETNKLKLEKEYDMRLRQMVFDKKSKPTERTKTKDEITAELAIKLQELESDRLRRMQENSIDREDEHKNKNGDRNSDIGGGSDDFGLGSGIKVRPSNIELDVEEEDDFIIDHTLVASDSEISYSSLNSSGDENEDKNENEDGNKDDVGLVDQDNNESNSDTVTEENSNKPAIGLDINDDFIENKMDDFNNESLPFEFPCPQSHKELLETVRDIDILNLPTVVQRIRILHSLKLRSENKIKLENFSVALVDHVYFLANQEVKPPFVILENLIRHIHSLAKSFPMQIATSFRQNLKEFNSSRAFSPSPGDLVLLTAISSIFPTSDHFHQVVTPALLTMGRYLGLKIPESLSELAIGSYVCTLCLHYQRLSKRYIPEVLNFIHNTLSILAPVKLTKLPGNFPCHEPRSSLRLKNNAVSAKKLPLFDIFTLHVTQEEQKEEAKASLLEANLKIIDVAADIWFGKQAYIETFQPSLEILEHLASSQCSSGLPESTKTILQKLTKKLMNLLTQSKVSRRPLELHHHRPLAIKSSIPKFEDSFNPDRHYDPDKSRADIARLKKEHKREKKGAIRELRKDAQTQAIQSLKEKKDRDAAYEKKYKRLVAEIQGEEGKEANAYEREKVKRRNSRKRK